MWPTLFRWRACWHLQSEWDVVIRYGSDRLGVLGFLLDLLPVLLEKGIECSLTFLVRLAGSTPAAGA